MKLFSVLIVLASAAISGVSALPGPAVPTNGVTVSIDTPTEEIIALLAAQSEATTPAPEKRNVLTKRLTYCDPGTQYLVCRCVCQ